MLRLRPAVLALALVLLPWLGLGCRVPSGALTPLDPGQLEARVELSQAAPSDDPVEHAMALAGAERALGRPERSAAAMLLALRRAESAEWMARLDGDPKALTEARRVRERTATRARRWAGRTDDPMLMVRAIVASAHPGRHRRALRAAVARMPVSPGAIDLARLTERVGAHAPSQRQIARWLDADPEEQQRLGLDAPLQATPDALDLWVGALDQAIMRDAPAPELKRAAVAVLAIDRSHIPAHLLMLGLDEVSDKTLEPDPELFTDLYLSEDGAPEDWPVLARLHLRQRASTQSMVLPLAQAWWMLREQLVGDAQQVLTQLRPPQGSNAQILHAQLSAMVAIERGESADFERWQATYELRAPWLDDWLLRFDHADHPEDIRAIARQARRRRAQRALPYDDELHRYSVLLDESLPADAHRWALDDLLTSREQTRAQLEICRAHGRDGSHCWDLWGRQGPLPSLVLAGRSRHFHPGLLSGSAMFDAAELDALAPVLDHYRDTIVAASPEYQEIQLRRWLAAEDYARARALLEERGAMLGHRARTWAWLVFDDLSSGALSFDESRRWLPRFEEQIESRSEPIEPEPELLIDRYSRAMSLAHHGQHAAALEMLRPVLDAVPDDAMVDGLAQAALAAHRSGDASTRDALRLRLHAVAPHHPVYARMQATLSHEAGRFEEARLFLAHALRWYPDDVPSYRAMVAVLADDPAPAEADALDFVARGAPIGEYFYRRIRRQIFRGDLQSMAQVEQIRAGLEGTPEQAWAVGLPLLSDFPLLAQRAFEWGIDQLVEAPSLASAQRWAEATLSLMEQVGPQGPIVRRQQAWLAMLTGRAQAGLAAVRLADARHGIEPLGDNDTVVQLLEARRAGEIDDALAWELWRWAYVEDPEAEARIEALLLDPPRGTILQRFACGELTTREDLGPATTVCGQAFEDQPESFDVAVAQSYVALNHPEPGTSESLTARVFGRSTFDPRFEQRSGPRASPELARVWNHNRAVWLGERGDQRASAMAWWQAYAFGLDDLSGQERGYGQLRWRGPMVRALYDAEQELSVRSRQLDRSILALTEGKPVAARAYAESARARVLAEPGTLSRDTLALPDRLLHLAGWVQADLDDALIDPEGVAEAIDLVFEPDLPRAQALKKAHPHASVVILANALAHQALDDDPPVRPLAEALLERYPDDPLAVTLVLPLIHGDDEQRARTLYERSVARHPDDAMLRHVDAPESITGPRRQVPDWVRDPARFDARIAEVTDAQVDGQVPWRHTSDERAAELFVPRLFEPVPDRPLRFVDGHGSRILVLSSPRASRCQGADCARDLLTGVAGQGRTKQWMRQTTLAGLEATQALFTSAEEVLVAWVVPSGGRVFTVVIAGPGDRFDALRPALVVVRDGMRPLDAVLPPFAAESLRKTGPTLRDGVRLRGRREQAQAIGSGCPVSRTLASMPHGHQRAQLLVDLWLATADSEQRRALLDCTDAEGPEARGLALPALLDEHPVAHAFGRRAVAHHPTRVVADAKTILSSPLSPPVAAPDYLRRNDLPSHGLIEVLGALPLAHARPLLERLLSSKDSRDRAMAWAAVELRPQLATEQILTDGLADEPRMVSAAAYLLSERGAPGDAAMLRQYLDARSTVSERGPQDALVDVAEALAAFVDPQDQARLEAAVDRVADGDDPERAERVRKDLREVARDHRRARTLLADPTARDPAARPSSAFSEDSDSDGRARRWSANHRRRARPFRAADDLRGKTLAQVLPGRDWTFARLAAPGLFSSTVADVAERLTTGDDAIDQRLGELTQGILRDEGFAALSESGGLDTARPIECAKPFDDHGWLCTAKVTDRDALLAVLGQRASGDDAGVALPFNVATTAGFVPIALSLLPAILHPLVYPDEDEDDEDGDEPQGAERARMQIEVGDVTLHRYSIVTARPRRISIDSERYLFIDDQLWVFSTFGTMDRVLRTHDERPLAQDPEFRRLTAGWQGGAALQAVSLGRAWPLASAEPERTARGSAKGPTDGSSDGPSRGASMEVVLDDSGLDFRYAGALDSDAEVKDIGPALDILPEGAITTFAHGLGNASPFDDPITAEGSDAARVPPMPVLAKAKGLAFGWYLEDGDRLWRRWLAVAPLDKALRSELTKAKTPAGRGRNRRHGGLCYRELYGHLLVGECELVDLAAASPPPPAASTDQLRVAHGTFDGQRAAQRLPGLGGLDLEKKAILRAVAPMLGIFTEMQVRADWIPAERTAVLEGHVGLQLRPPGDHIGVIDDWLAASEGHNAANLPRRLRAEELEAPLRYRIEVPDAAAFVRDTLADSPRTHAEVIDDTHVLLTVAPVPTKAPKVPLSAKQLKEATKRTSTLRIDDPDIVEVARSLVPEGTAPKVAARTISEWVHERLTYEITPRSLDGASILEAGRGDCSEYAVLTVTLLRAAGVPAQVRDGMAASGDELVAHAWVAYHDGQRWHEIDPTWGRATASAGHLEMSVLDALALISLGKLKIVEISAAP